MRDTLSKLRAAESLFHTFVLHLPIVKKPMNSNPFPLTARGGLSFLLLPTPPLQSCRVACSSKQRH